MPSTERSARLDLPYIQAAQAQKHVTHNEALQKLDAAVQLAVAAFESHAPPVLPEHGDTYALASSPTGDWDGEAGKLAYWNGFGWLFLEPKEGWLAYDLAAQVLRQWRAGAWVAVLEDLTGLGIGTSSDATNRLAVAAQASLFTHVGSDHRIKVNKAAAADTASIVFQSNWSGRAEIGLMGADSLSVKVSADGVSFTTALNVNPASGLLTGAAVSQSSSDLTVGRLLTVGAGAAQLDPSLYRRGNILGAVSQSGGVPSGSVIERGQNANGSYVRFACGTQICTRRVQLDAVSINTAMGSLFRANVGSFDFPAVFTQVEAVSVTVMGSHNASIRNSAGLLKTRQGSSSTDADWVGVTLWSPASIAGVAGELTNLSLFAIGRWF